MFPALLAVIIAIAAAVTVRVLPDHGAVPDLLGPEVVPDRLVLSDPRDLRENLVYRDIQGQSELLLRQYMHNTEIAVTMRLSTILKTIKQPL